MTVEAVRVLLEAGRVIIQAVRKIIEAVRLAKVGPGPTPLSGPQLAT